MLCYLGMTTSWVNMGALNSSLPQISGHKTKHTPAAPTPTTNRHLRPSCHPMALTTARETPNAIDSRNPFGQATNTGHPPNRKNWLIMDLAGCHDCYCCPQHLTWHHQCHSHGCEGACGHGGYGVASIGKGAVHCGW